jgi:predicted acylesterase/phospholipase RssA
MKTIARGWGAGTLLFALAAPQCLAQISEVVDVSSVSDLRASESSERSVPREFSETSLDWSADSSHQSILAKRLLLSQGGQPLASSPSPSSIAPLSAVAPFSLIAYFFERADPAARPTTEGAELMASFRARYALLSQADRLCRRKPSATDGGREWSKLVRAIQARSRLIDVQTLTMAIEQLDALHADPKVRRRALDAAKELLDCPQGYGTEAELLMIALGASAFEIDNQEVSEAWNGVEHSERLWQVLSASKWAEGAVPRSTADALAIALYEPPPLPIERDLYPVNKRSDRDAPDAPPRLCLALSGGGIRSAAFQIGVLQGLRDRGLLSRVDLISAVSGGGYATSWFISSRLEEAGVRMAFPDNMFRSEVIFERPSGHQKANPPPPQPYAFLDEAKVSALDSRFSRLVSLPEGLFLALAGLPAVLIEAPYDSLESDLPSFLLEHRSYTRLLQKAYSIPDYPLAGLARRLARVPDLAYPIFSATAHAGTCSEEPSPTLGFAADLRTSSFELAPSQVGSIASGFSSAAPYLYTVADAAAISGAAIDIPSGLVCSAFKRAYVRLGARLPAAEGKLMYVTDGGYSDNLALVPLLRRNCQAIIVSDAEHDPQLTFSGYQRLAEALKRQRIGTLEVKDIECLTAQTSRPCGQGDPHPCFVTSKTDESAPRRSRQQERGWFTGTVRMAGVPDGEGIPLLYLKMTVDESKLDTYPTPVAEAIDWHCRRPYCEFPHIPTTRQWLPTVQFRGLRHLGRHLMGQAVENGGWPPAALSSRP